MVDVVATEVRMDAVGVVMTGVMAGVMPIMMVVQVRVHERGAQRANRHGHTERNREQPPHHLVIVRDTSRTVNSEPLNRLTETSCS